MHGRQAGCCTGCADATAQNAYTVGSDSAILENSAVRLFLYVPIAVAGLVLNGCDSGKHAETVTENEPPATTETVTRSESPAASVSDIVAANTEALGGAVALDAVQTLVKTTLIEEGDYRDLAVFATDRQGRMRIDIYAGGERVYTESFDGQHGHQWRPGEGQSYSSALGTVALSHTPQLPNHIFRLKDMAANGHTLELLREEENEHVLRLTLSDGFENFLLVDKRSGLIKGSRNRRSLHVDIDPEVKSLETRVSDFRTVTHIRHAHRVSEVDRATGEVLSCSTLLDVEVNAALSVSYFSDLVDVAPDTPATPGDHVRCLPAAPAESKIDASQLSEIVRAMATEEFGGRAPGTPGEDKTVAYLVERFSELGLEPGGENRSWTQSVPLVHTQVRSPEQIQFAVGDQPQSLTQQRDLEISTVRPLEKIEIADAPVVFVGFGAHAPERDWDDYGGIDLKNKVALFLVNDPDFAAAPDEPAAGVFGNRRMTYYGRWAYKFEEAARRGAAVALVIHETKAAGYGWNVASSSPGENYSIVRGQDAAKPVTLQGWLHNDAATKLLTAAGHDLDKLRVAARSPDFEAFELDGTTFNADLDVSVETIESQNVLAKLPGTTRPDETIMVSAHWDSYGVGEPDAQGRVVRPGANDDALGTADVLELARVLKAGAPLERSVIFAAWTAEESGLLGSEAYAADPLYPLEKTVANLTLDILLTAGLARDVILVGEGQSELEDDLARAAALQGRTVTPENLPENGLFFRADHFSLARRGVPVLLIMAIAGGADLVDGGRDAGDQWIADYIGNCYHQTCDSWDPYWDLRGAVQDIELLHTIIRDLGNSDRWPQWKAGSEFKALRDESSAARDQAGSP